ncbi:hypothetical protein H1R20_g7979, partial [Candolleomyces eurysporus]
MATRKSGLKRKKGVTFHDIPEPEGSSSSQTAPRGHTETYTETFRREGVRVTTTLTVQIPPSPVKPKPAVRSIGAENVHDHSSQPTHADNPFNEKSEGNNKEFYIKSPYDTLWHGDDESSADEREGGEPKLKRWRTQAVGVLVTGIGHNY